MGEEIMKIIDSHIDNEETAADIAYEIIELLKKKGVLSEC